MKRRCTRQKTALDNNTSVTSPSVDPKPCPPITTSQQQPKHSCSNSDASAEVSASDLCQPTAKRTKLDTPSPDKNSHNVASRPRPRPRPIIAPRSPLPQRSNRVINPGAPDQKRAQRSSEEVAAAAKQKEERALELEKVEKARILMVAEIEEEEEEDERLKERMAIRHITDLPEFKTGGDVVEDEDEPEGPAKMRRKPARVRGNVRAAVDTERKKLASAKFESKNSKSLIGTTASKPTGKVPSGLVQDWRTKRSKASHSALESEHLNSPLGGLEDDSHADLGRPCAMSVEHKTRKNELIAMDDSDSDLIEYRSGKNKAGAMSNQKNSKSKEVVMCDSDGQESGINKASAMSNQKNSKSKEVVMWDSDSDFIEYKPSVKKLKTSAEPSVRDLPEFVRADWIPRFLPTLFHRFGISIDPWGTFSKGEEMLKAVQAVINSVFPGNTYRVKWGDAICAAVNSRLYAKRSSFGIRALQAVEEFFKTDEFVNSPTRIARYAQWAVRGDGPALWRVPTPQDCEYDSQSHQYIKPIDIFQSEFILKTFAPFIKGCKDSCVNYGYLIGALAMSAAAVECAFKMFFTGIRAFNGPFSRDNVERVTANYVENTKKLSKKRWTLILKACGADENGKPIKEQTVVTTLGMDEHRRRTLYIPSSPAPMDTD